MSILARIFGKQDAAAPAPALHRTPTGRPKDMLCPRCRERQKHVRKSGRVAWACRECLGMKSLDGWSSARADKAHKALLIEQMIRQGWTLAECGWVFGVTRERVRQLLASRGATAMLIRPDSSGGRRRLETARCVVCDSEFERFIGRLQPRVTCSKDCAAYAVKHPYRVGRHSPEQRALYQARAHAKRYLRDGTLGIDSYGRSRDSMCLRYTLRILKEHNEPLATELEAKMAEKCFA